MSGVGILASWCARSGAPTDGANFHAMEHHKTDIGLSRELRAHEEQAPRELGQRTERSEPAGRVQEVEASATRRWRS
jgi:hypothetical protein